MGDAMRREQNVLVVSDLHLSEGLDPESNRTSRLEDFLFDDAFARFLRYHQAARAQPRFGGRPWLLILDGDLFDFLQVVTVPEDGLRLRTIKGVGRRDELPPNQRRYGLGTTAEESEWKLNRIARGHQRFFAALGRFVAQGNHVAVVKGNHDVELHWGEVQERFAVEANRAYTRERLRLGQGPRLTLEMCRERIRFYPWYYHEPGRIYVEHGCQYEAPNHFRNFLNPVLPDDPERIELPWGSLFVRYLFNEVEDVHPFADNVKPLTRYLSWAFKTDPIRAIEVLMTRGVVFLRAFWEVGRKTAASALRESGETGRGEGRGAARLPRKVTVQIEALAERRVGDSWREWAGSALQSLALLLMLLIAGTLTALAGLSLAGVGGPRWMAGPYVALALLSYFLRRQMKRRFAHLLDRNYLLAVARELEEILDPDHSVRYVVMGHDHRATVERLDGAWYVNTGAWVPVYEREGPIEGREQLTFFRLPWGYEGTPELLRWDDAAGAPTPVVLWEDRGR